jgi:predicted glycogen debranching enzyme
MVMILSKGPVEFADFGSASRNEWLETNGLGGWSGSTLCGCNTRRYHGLLMAAVKPPADRMLLVSKLEETVVVSDTRYELGTNDYGVVVSPSGFQYLRSFKKDPFSEWIFEMAAVRIQKSITMVHGENTTLIRYEILEAALPFEMEFLPLIAARGYHELQHATNNIFWDTQFENGIFHNRPFDGAPDIYISIPGSAYNKTDQWFYHFNYAVEKYRGLDFEEDLFNHGLFRVSLKQGDVLEIIVSTENPAARDFKVLFESERQRKSVLIQENNNELFNQLSLAADQFIVQRNMPAHGSDEPVILKTVIAGYHWFTDWGRDTMISLPGLCLATGRYDDAKKIISVFGKSVSMGMLPNRFMDNNEPPEYNNVDGTLWYFMAIHYYLQATNDNEFILKEILPVLKEIVEWHFKGTRYNIHADIDGLLYAGEKGMQLTWMDAKIGDWVVTPRSGKPVEIQALWYNALKIFEVLLLLNGESAQASVVHQKSDQAKNSFQQKFWYPGGNYLYDVIDEEGNPDTSLRPNQVFAISLPYPLVEGGKASSILKVTEEKLYTDFGLRSLSPDDPRYSGHYGGTVLSRDSSYHQGPVWSWLIGAYIEAQIKTVGKSFKAKASTIVQKFANQLGEGCIGSVSEIFDGDPPHHPGGCVAQAWGVAEILRVLKTYNL